MDSIHAGNYTCTAKNDVGSAESTIYVDVLGMGNTSKANFIWSVVFSPSDNLLQQRRHVTSSSNWPDPYDDLRRQWKTGAGDKMV